MKSENNKKRILKSALQKRRALLEISKGADIKETIIDQIETKDKKYANKMYHKWKKYSFAKKPDMQQCGFGNDLSDVDVDYELSAFEFKTADAGVLYDLIQHEKKEENKKCFERGYALFSNKCFLYQKTEKSL